MVRSSVSLKVTRVSNRNAALGKEPATPKHSYRELKNLSNSPLLLDLVSKSSYLVFLTMVNRFAPDLVSKFYEPRPVNNQPFCGQSLPPLVCGLRGPSAILSYLPVPKGWRVIGAYSRHSRSMCHSHLSWCIYYSHELTLTLNFAAPASHASVAVLIILALRTHSCFHKTLQ